MSFSATVGSDVVAVEAGATVPISIEVSNRSPLEERFEIQVEGLDPEWTAVPVPVFSLGPNETQGEKLFFKPPRSSESLAGNYPYVVRIRSLESGEAKSIQGVLQIKPFNHLSIEVNPKRGMASPWKKQNQFHVTLMNLGNTEHTVQLYGSEPDDACAFDFEHEQVTLAPGQQKTMDLFVDPTSSRLFSSSRLYMFTVSARSIEHPSVVSSTQAQLEQRPLLSPVAMVALVLFLLIGGLWLYLLPKPPVLDSITADRREVTIGDPVTISWRSSNSSMVRLLLNGAEFTSGAPSGSITHSFSEPGRFTIQAYAMKDDKRSRPIDFSIQVNAPIPAEPPRIDAFSIEPRKLGLNDTFVVRYKVNDAVTKLTLAPTGEELDPRINERELRATRLGQIQYRLIAFNKEGARTEKSVTVTVADPTEPRIVQFQADPKEVDPDVGVVSLSWQLVNTVRQELVVQGKRPVDVEATQRLDVPVVETTTFTLQGWDAQGRRVSQNITVTVKPPPPPPVDDTTGGDTGSTTGGTG